MPPNVPSYGPEAYGFSELGDGVILAPGTPRLLTSVTMIMSDWACQTGHWYNNAGTPGACTTTAGATFNHPITMNIYSVVPGAPPTPGGLIATRTVTFAIPYRPSADGVHCPGTGQWFSTATGKCYNGLAFPVTFDFSAAQITLPDQVIVTLAYNTSTYGASPLAPKPCNTANNDNNCPYDSLNIGTFGGAIIGANLDPTGIWVNYSLPNNSCSGTATPGLKDDQGCWGDSHPNILMSGIPAGAFQLKYFNTNYGSGQIIVSNAGSSSTGLNPADDSSGTICANVYSFDPNEEMQTCCSCPVTPNGLSSLNVNEDILAQNLIVNPSRAITVKVLYSSKSLQNAGGVCDPTKVTGANLAPGGLAWGTNLRNVTFQGSPPTTMNAVTETRFTSPELSMAELAKLTTYCQYIKILGSNVSGICKSCQPGARGSIGK